MALLHQLLLRTVTAVGTLKDNKFVCDSTSFHIGFLVEDAPRPEDRRYQMFLLTNRHVLEGRESVTFRVNTDDGGYKTFETKLQQDGENIWLAHPDSQVDLALLTVNADLLKSNGIEPTFLPEEMFAYTKDFDEIGISPGDDLFVLGFPMGIAGEEQNHVCVKAGIVSRMDNEILKTKKAFIIDSSIFPGNSGGPVIIKPTNFALEDTKFVAKPYLLGVVMSYIPYIDNLYTHQTKPPSVVSTTRENSGLSYCVPMDFAKDIYKSWLEQQKILEKPEHNIAADTLDDIVKTNKSD